MFMTWKLQQSRRLLGMASPEKRYSLMRYTYHIMDGAGSKIDYETCGNPSDFHWHMVHGSWGDLPLCQVYNEQVDDLLNPDHQNGQGRGNFLKFQQLFRMTGDQEIGDVRLKIEGVTRS